MTEQNFKEPAMRNVAEIIKLEEAGERQSPLGARLGLAITRTAGTFGFALIQTAALAVWCGWNTLGPEGAASTRIHSDC